MSAPQVRWVIVAAAVLLTVLLVQSAFATGEWVGLVVSAVGLIVPLSIAWWVLGGSRV